MTVARCYNAREINKTILNDAHNLISAATANVKKKQEEGACCTFASRLLLLQHVVVLVVVAITLRPLP